MKPAATVRAVLDAVVAEDPDWLAVQFEATRRIRTDPDFRKVVEEQERELAATCGERLERLRPYVRDDVPLEATAIFLSFVPAVSRCGSHGDELPDFDALAKLVDEGVAPR